MHRHQRQRYVVIPSRPTPGLGLMQAQLLLGFLKQALDPVAVHLALHGRQHGQGRRIRRRAADTILDLETVQFTRNQQLNSLRCLLIGLPQPHRHPPRPPPQRPFRTRPMRIDRPRLAPPRHHRHHLDRLRHAHWLAPFRRPAPPAPPRTGRRRGVGGVPVQRGLNIEYIGPPTFAPDARPGTLVQSPLSAGQLAARWGCARVARPTGCVGTPPKRTRDGRTLVFFR